MLFFPPIEKKEKKTYVLSVCSLTFTLFSVFFFKLYSCSHLFHACYDSACGAFLGVPVGLCVVFASLLNFQEPKKKKMRTKSCAWWQWPSQNMSANFLWCPQRTRIYRYTYIYIYVYIYVTFGRYLRMPAWFFFFKA